MNKPLIIRTIAEMNEYRKSIISKTIGFVPTMGYLHSGHLSLVKQSNLQSDITIVSIYVNPSQFGVNEDLDKYPKDFERDLLLLSELSVDVIFSPNTSEMYPQGYKTWIEVESISTLYCGASRPGHFKGVTTIVAKFMNIILPDLMFMGEKDFQQVTILNKMIKDLNFNTKIIPCPIVRESDGLAMSSRNSYLNNEQRIQALCLNRSLLYARKQFKEGNKNAQEILEQMRNIILKENGKIDYIEFINPNTLEKTDFLTKDTRILIAVYIGQTRLIDNMSFGD